MKRVLVNRGDHVKAGQLLAELEAPISPPRGSESKQPDTNRPRRPIRRFTGATVPEDQTKAQADVQAAQQALDAAKKVYDSRVELQKQGALAQKLVDDAQGRHGAGAEPVRYRAAASAGAATRSAEREQMRGAQAQVERGEGALRQRRGAGRLRADPQSRSAASCPTGRFIPAKCRGRGTPIVSIVDISQVVARANVPVKEAAPIQRGQARRRSPGPTAISPGKVTVVSPAVDPSTTTVEVWVQAPIPASG